ncbi:MAG: hypothetical protein JWN43_326 [Gammaproteobacteria bacterium]|nr:hypothetical protein [Gammaproteobacteria bacterium]
MNMNRIAIPSRLKWIAGGVATGLVTTFAAIGFWDVVGWAFHHIGLCVK